MPFDAQPDPGHNDPKPDRREIFYGYIDTMFDVMKFAITISVSLEDLEENIIMVASRFINELIDLDVIPDITYNIILESIDSTHKLQVKFPELSQWMCKQGWPPIHR